MPANSCSAGVCSSVCEISDIACELTQTHFVDSLVIFLLHTSTPNTSSTKLASPEPHPSQFCPPRSLRRSGIKDLVCLPVANCSSTLFFCLVSCCLIFASRQRATALNPGLIVNLPICTFLSTSSSFSSHSSESLAGLSPSPNASARAIPLPNIKYSPLIKLVQPIDR